MKKMNCQQFQELLPYMIESGGKAEEEAHLRSCPSCASLVEDLRYIAEQAKLLLPMHDPNPRVWSNIERSLQSQGLFTEGRMSRLGHITKNPTQAKSWTPLGWAMALTAAIVFTVVLTNYRQKQLPQGQLTAQNSGAEPAQFNSDDRQLISQLSLKAPDARGTYEDSLREVNSYISDAEQAAQRDPGDASAQELLQDAYQQKEMLYQMATARSLD
jgi:hypothetical protein